MSTDLIERLREDAGGKPPTMQWQKTYHEAADEIEQLRRSIEIYLAEITRLRAALATYTAANGEELPKGSAGTTIVNDGRPT
jgi:hypothetical protein